jgi:hypothetical protein
LVEGPGGLTGDHTQDQIAAPGGPSTGYSSSMAGATIKIFLADGTPLGLRVLEKSNWTGRGFDFARSDWPKVRTRDDFSRPGVYVLRGLTDDGLVKVYIGEADELRSRLNQHFAGPGAKEFWERAVAFTSKDENLNKAHVRFLESRLIQLAMAAKRVQLENGTAPAAPSLSEYDRAEAETFLDEMLVIYPLLGIDAFSPPPTQGIEASRKLQLSGRGVSASGLDATEGFIVLEGSLAAKTEVASLPDYVRRLRATLLADGVLAEAGTTYKVCQDYAFNSPSLAAAVLLGRTANGRAEWKAADGRTLGTLQDQAT